MFDEVDDKQSAKLLSSSSYVDDNAILVATPKEAFDIDKKAESAFNKYSAKMHEPIVSLGIFSLNMGILVKCSCVWNSDFLL